MQKKQEEAIALIIGSKGVKGYCLIGKTVKEKEESLKLYALLESDLRKIGEMLNARIKTLLKKAD
jgi:hypothetical protein